MKSIIKIVVVAIYVHVILASAKGIIRILKKGL